MVPDINCDNLYTILFSCVEYVDYFNVIDDDDLLDKVIEILYRNRFVLEKVERSDIDGIELED